jgi:lysophospholipid acyltransferase (LPLAT)-like uncharacterized protein
MKIRNPKLIRALTRILGWGLRLWFRCVRVRIVLETPGINPYADAGDERYLYCLWHDAIIGVLFTQTHRRMAGLVSLHADGGWVADTMEIFGIRAIRGSSGRRGAGAIREMMSAAQDWHIAITSDGPRGPRREIKDGILYLASQSGRAIVPMVFAGRSAWRPRGSWTDMVIPWPWSRAVIAGVKPIVIPPGLRPDELRPYRDLVQQEMDAVHAFSEQLVRDEKLEFFAGWRTKLGFAERSVIEPVRRAA